MKKKGKEEQKKRGNSRLYTEIVGVARALLTTPDC
jgi:hypothetical protein